MKIAVISPLLLLIFGCSNDEDSSGRYQVVQSSGEMPTLLVDTQTGCVERFVKFTNVENSQEVSWRRTYMDGTVPEVLNGNVTEGSAPPHRCPPHQEAAK